MTLSTSKAPPPDPVVLVALTRSALAELLAPDGVTEFRNGQRGFTVDDCWCGRGRCGLGDGDS